LSCFVFPMLVLPVMRTIKHEQVGRCQRHPSTLACSFPREGYSR
jgi:hypothetical protein